MPDIAIGGRHPGFIQKADMGGEYSCAQLKCGWVSWKLTQAARRPSGGQSQKRTRVQRREVEEAKKAGKAEEGVCNHAILRAEGSLPSDRQL